MSDPRGRGFKRGRGRWHAPAQQQQVIDPVKLGWQRDTETEQEQYTLGDVILQPCLQGGWLTIQTATIAGRTIEYRSQCPYELLPALTASFKIELEAVA